MHPTPHMPVEEHRRRLGNALFQITNGFGQVKRGVADVAAPPASIGPVGIGLVGISLVSAEAVDDTLTEAVDPRRDSRPEADGIFSPAFVDVPDDLKRSARSHRRTLPVMDVIAAWSRSEWGHMAYLSPVGEEAMLASKADFTAALPHLGTGRVAHYAAENFVCREYGFLGAVHPHREGGPGVRSDTDPHGAGTLTGGMT